jgi:hypothetical protein
MKRRFCGLRVGFLVAAVLLSMLPVGASARGAPVKHSLGVSPSAARRVASFWTPARMRRARPIPLLRRSYEALRSPNAVPLGDIGSVHFVPPAPPSGQARASDTAISDPSVDPYSENGRVFVSLGSVYASCSATVINTANASVVFTAGHCVNTGGPGGHWYGRRWAFVPGYHGGLRPLGTFQAKETWASNQWLRTGSENYDLGAAVLYRNGRRQRVAAAAGAYGIATGQSPNQTFDVFGYPAAPPFTGGQQWECPAVPYLGPDPSWATSPGPPNLGIECDHSGGSSGGGWIIDGQYLNSVTSYGYAETPNISYGPYFGNAAWRLFKAIRHR